MTRIANEAPRRYRSELRVEQLELTRGRILDAALRVAATGLAGLSIPAVAREAGVSVPTVYRHFGTKAELLAAIYPHAAGKAGLDLVPDPSTVAEVGSLVRELIERLDAMDDMSRAALASPIADEVRHATMPSRLQRVRRLAASIDPPLSATAADRITRLLVVLVSSSSLRMWRDQLGATADQAADDIDWLLRAAIAAARAEEAP
jgi:AcrR family transcriptional regulator